MQSETLDLATPILLSEAPVWINELPCCVQAGFPSPAEDHMVQRVDLMTQLIRHPQATYLLRVRGMSMQGAGILDGDLLAVHKTKEAREGQIVVARLGDEVTVKRLHRTRHGIELLPENPDFKPIVVGADDAFELEGIAVGLIRNNPLM